jgi:hypothetical protein
MRCDFQIYAHYLDDGSIFYIGKGVPGRATCFSKRTKIWNRTVSKYCAAGKPRVVILSSNLTEAAAFEREKGWIHLLGRKTDNTGRLVNYSAGGEYGATGYKHTADAVAKTVAFHTGRKRSPETRAKIAEKAKGRVVSEETKAKLSAMRIGKPKTEEHKNKVAATKMKPVLCVELNIEFKSATEAGDYFNSTAKRISRVCLGERKTHKGYSFKYLP